jgi:hypothetical protein
VWSFALSRLPETRRGPERVDSDMPQRASTIPRDRSAQEAQAESQIRVPTNVGELQALEHLRGELRSQLGTLTQLRQELTNQIAQAAAVGDRTSIGTLQGRIRNLESRSARLEEQMLQVDDAVRAAIAQGVAVAPPEAGSYTPAVAAMPPVLDRPADMIDEDVLMSALMGMTLLFTFIGVLIHRRAWRRAEKHFAATGIGGRPEMQQLQQAVDVIAVEVERIAEGQRFVSKLLNDRLESPALRDGRERVSVPVEDADASPRGR